MINEGMFVRERITPLRLPISAPTAMEQTTAMISRSQGALCDSEAAKPCPA